VGRNSNVDVKRYKKNTKRKRKKKIPKTQTQKKVAQRNTHRWKTYDRPTNLPKEKTSEEARRTTNKGPSQEQSRSNEVPAQSILKPNDGHALNLPGPKRTNGGKEKTFRRAKI